MSINSEQYIRKVSLILAINEKGLDLSEFHFTFNVMQGDQQSPNNAVIRVYNLAPTTVKTIKGEYARVILQAGYENGNFGVIFDGTIKQFRVGRENATDTYLDILAADLDIGYNFGVVNTTLAPENSSSLDVINAASKAMNTTTSYVPPSLGGVIPRGKVLFGMGRDYMRQSANSNLSTWSIQNGKVQVIPLTSYLPGEAVVLTSLTGMVGIPEQTDQGIKVRCLLNPRLRVGGLVQIDNESINQTLQGDLTFAGFQQSKLPVGQVPFNQWTGIQLPADITNDGYYRLYVCEYSGDTRVQAWYSDLICLAVDISTDTVKAFG